MGVRQLIETRPASVVTVEASASLATAAHLLMRHGIGGLPVVRGGELVGFLAEREIAAALDAQPEPIARIPVERVMRRPPPTCSADDSLEMIMVRMTRERLRHLVVLEGGRIAGIISVGDIVKHRLEQLELEAGVLRDYVAAQRAVR